VRNCSAANRCFADCCGRTKKDIVCLIAEETSAADSLVNRERGEQFPHLSRAAGAASEGSDDNGVGKVGVESLSAAVFSQTLKVAPIIRRSHSR